MEIKNHTAYTYDNLMEFNRHHQRKLLTATRIVFGIIAGLEIIVLIAGLILTATLGGDPITPSDFTTPALYVLAAVFFFVWPPLRGKKICRKQASVHTVVDYVFTEEGFTETSTSDTIHEQRSCKYDIILKITESDRAFYLYVTSRVAHIVSKDGFTEGNEADFRTLLRTVIDPKKLRIR